MNGTARTLMIGGTVVVWGAVHLAGLLNHFPVSPTFDQTMTTLAGVILATTTRKQDKPPKD